MAIELKKTLVDFAAKRGMNTEQVKKLR